MKRVADVQDPWLRCFRAGEEPRLRLVLFPHAGGSASFYREWAWALPDTCELWIVQYPGRENRIAEPLIPRMEPLADTVGAVLEQHLDGRPYAVLGHSMGSAVAYECALRLSRSSAGPPLHFFASGRGVPTRWNRTEKHTLDEDALAAVVEDLGATPPGVLDEPEIRALVLGIVRNDYELIETYRPHTAPPLDVPITAFAGQDDTTVTPDEVKEWTSMTTRGCDVDVFPGGHFFPAQNRDEVIAALVRDLDPHLTRL